MSVKNITDKINDATHNIDRLIELSTQKIQALHKLKDALQIKRFKEHNPKADLAYLVLKKKEVKIQVNELVNIFDSDSRGKAYATTQKYMHKDKWVQIQHFEPRVKDEPKKEPTPEPKVVEPIQPLFEIWSEGYVVTGERSLAKFHGTRHANSFEEAFLF